MIFASTISVRDSTLGTMIEVGQETCELWP